MSARPIRRGQPLVALLLVMSSWVGARIVLWETPTWPLQRTAVRPPEPALVARPLPVAAVAHPDLPANAAMSTAIPPQAAYSLSRTASAPQVVSPFASGLSTLPPAPPFEPAPRFASSRVAGGHQLLWLAAVAQLPMPAGLADSAPAPTPSRQSSAPAGAGTLSPWSMDGWLLLRRGGAGLAVAGAPGTYGASQVGAVLRYRLSSSPLQPRAYLRASSAVRRPHDAEAAVGLSARPVGALPITAQAELRVSTTGGGNGVRPAAMLVSALDPAELPLGLRAETYAAAGYVGGRDATGFAEGQVRVDRVLARVGDAQVRLGVGAWGGAQKGASRADVGPSATVGLAVGPASARVSADWRFRIAGQASPGSGPALTISAGF